MSRLPVVSGDLNAWGAILNDYLSQEHTATGGHGNITATQLTMTASNGNGSIVFPDPTLNSNPIVWGTTQVVQLISNSSGNGLTMSLATGSFVFTVLRRDIAIGTRELGRLTFEGANANGLAFRPGYMFVSQTDNTAVAESGYLGFFTRFGGSDSEKLRIGDLPTSAVRIMNASLQLIIEFNATNRLMFQHNGTNGYIGTQTNQSLILRSNNTDRITVDTAGVITFAGYGGGTGAISVGAVDSGGAGFRLLRVPN